MCCRSRRCRCSVYGGTLFAYPPAECQDLKSSEEVVCALVGFSEIFTNSESIHNAWSSFDRFLLNFWVHTSRNFWSVPICTMEARHQIRHFVTLTKRSATLFTRSSSFPKSTSNYPMDCFSRFFLGSKRNRRKCHDWRNMFELHMCWLKTSLPQPMFIELRIQ